jgi:hypothetical protein
MYQKIKKALWRIDRFIKTFPFMVRMNRGLLFTLRQLGYHLIHYGTYGFRQYCGMVEDQRLYAISHHPAPKRHQSDSVGSLIEEVWDSADENHVRRLKEMPAKHGYVIYSPDFAANSAGVVCLFRLCDCLNRLGYHSYLAYARRTPPDMITLTTSLRYARKLAQSGYTAVYPEYVSGNPLGAPYVARWVLNRPGLLGGDEIYDQHELVFYYSEVYLPYIKNHVSGKLYMPTIDESIFYHDGRSSESRSLECFYVGKSKWKDGFCERDKVFEITRQYPRKTELGNLFRASRLLYCFDNSTILVYEAIACGCPVVIIPDGTQTWEDFQRLELGTDGICWGLAGVERTKVDLFALHSRLNRVKGDYKRQLVEFIYLTQKRALG